MMENQININNFFNVAADLKNLINDINKVSFVDNHKRTLLFNLLDMLANSVYGVLREGHRYRFVQFVQNFCEWEHGDYISLQQLILLIEERDSEGGFNDLKVFAKNELAKFPRSTPVPFKFDSHFEVVKSMLPEGTEKVCGVKLESLTHLHLLYRLRNSLTHEMRNLGSNPLFEEGQPHYIGYYSAINNETGDFDHRKLTWEMIYPVKFYNDLIDTALIKMKSYFEKYDINPYDKFTFTPLWV